MRIGFFLGMSALSVGCLNAAVEQQNAGDGLPNPAARFRSDSSTVSLFADLLVWSAAESGADNWAEVIYPSGSTTHCKIQDVRFNWNAGVRVGLDYGMHHDQWDTSLYYTWFRTKGTHHTSGPLGSVFSSFMGNFYIDNSTGAGISGVPYEKASMDWTIRFNMFDWELGRAFSVSRALSVRPFVGLKGGWIHQSIHSKWKHPDLSDPKYAGATPFTTATENLKNNFWGLGPSAGLNTKWSLLRSQRHLLNLFGDFSGAIMWGHWTFRDAYRNDIGQKVSIDVSPIDGGASMLRMLMGLEWGININAGQSRFSTRLGYEMQCWLDQLQFYSFDAGRLSDELTFQGGTLEFRFDF